VAWSDRAAEEETGTGARSGDGGGPGAPLSSSLTSTGIRLDRCGGGSDGVPVSRGRMGRWA
jgi:hypothetical protein